MSAVDLEAGLSLKLLEEGSELFVLNLHGVPAAPADQVMVVAPGGFINVTPITNVGDQGQLVLNQELEGTVHRGLGQTGESLYSTLINGGRRHMTTIFLQDVQNRQPLGRQAMALFA